MKHAVKADIPKCPICGKAEYTVEKTDELFWSLEFRITCDCTKFATRVSPWNPKYTPLWWRGIIIKARKKIEEEWARVCREKKSARLAEKLEKLCDVLDKHADAIANEPDAYYGRNDAIFGFTFAKKRIEAILAEEKNNT